MSTQPISSPEVRTLSPAAVVALADMLSWAADHGTRVRVAWDGGLKLDVGDGVGWSRAYGEPSAPTGGYLA